MPDRLRVFSSTRRIFDVAIVCPSTAAVVCPTHPSRPGPVAISQQHELGDRYHPAFTLVVQHRFHLSFDRYVQLREVFRLHGFFHQVYKKTAA